MRANWQDASLGDVAAINYGFTAKAEAEPIGPKFLRITDIQNGGVDWRMVPHCRIAPDEISKFSLATGDIVFARTGATTGKSFRIADPPTAVFASYLIRLRLRDDRLLPEFVSYYFQTDQYWESVRSGVSGSAQGGFNASKLAALSVPLPALPEQRRIVGILDAAFESIATARANTERNLENARAVFESELEALFTRRGEGWIEKPLRELCDIKHGFAFKSEFFASEGDYVVLTPGNFYESGGYRDRGEKQKYFVGEIPRGFVLDEGDLLVAMTEQAAGLLGSPIIVPQSDRFLHNQRLGLVTKRNGVPWLNEFFFHVFNAHVVRKEIHDSASGVKVRHTSPTKIGNVVVSFPSSVSKQTAIVTALKDLRIETQRLEFLCRQKLAGMFYLAHTLRVG